MDVKRQHTLDAAAAVDVILRDGSTLRLRPLVGARPSGPLRRRRRPDAGSTARESVAHEELVADSWLGLRYELASKKPRSRA
jgi:hypothetical protein